MTTPGSPSFSLDDFCPTRYTLPMSFVHLHVHSDYSLLDGAAPLKKLIKAAKEMGMPALALTDHGNLFGALKFQKECKEAGIKAIVGCEVYVAPESRLDKKGNDSEKNYHHLILLAKNVQGWKNLMELVSLGYTEGFYYKPRVDKELLAQYSEGLICLSACIGGEIPQLILTGREVEAAKAALWYKDTFGEGNYFLELQDHGIDDQQRVNPVLKSLSVELNIPLVATNDAHYVAREDANAQDTLICIGTNKKKNDVNRMSFGGDGEFYLKSEQEMASLFADVPEALENTLKIADMVDMKIPTPGPLLPDYPIPEDFAQADMAQVKLQCARVQAFLDPENTKPEVFPRFDLPITQYFVWQSNLGLEKRYKILTKEIQDRLDFELAVIIRMDFVGYFLIVADFINWSKDHDIPVGPGRGSGAGSIVAYALRITDIEPLKYGLLFERFLNPERVSMPDFDVDFADEGREDVIHYVTEKYGKDRVGQIITFGTLKAKAVIKDVARVLDIGFNESNILTKLVPDKPPLDEKGKPLPLYKLIHELPELEEYYNRGGIYKELFDTAAKLENLNRHASTHAAGVVIGKTKLTDYVPLYRDSKTGAISTQFTMELLEDCGLVKMDFLGLKTLTIIKNTLKLVNKKRAALKEPLLVEENIPEDDANTFKMLGDGKSSMVFQFESEGMQKILKDAKPTCIEDLIALNALYRPGPMENIPQFVDCKWGRKKIVYPHASLEKILKETYGVIVYQEQVMQATQIVAGYTLGGADLLRRAMGKKKIEEMAKQRLTFNEGALKTHGIPEAKSNEIFDLLEKFAGYGFNKSHAAAYSVIAYKTAYLKANFPAEYLAANLTNEITNPDTLSKYLAEARDMKLEVLPPHINYSDKLFSVYEGKIVFGLLGIKNVGEASVEEVLKQRAKGGLFTSFQDFLERIDLGPFNAKFFETAIKCGVFEGMGMNRATILGNLEKWLDQVKRHKEEQSSGQGGLFDDTGELDLKLEVQEFPEWPKKELLEFEKLNLGLFVSGHPLDDFKEEWKKTVSLDLSRPSSNKDEEYQLMGILSQIRVISTKKGAKMAWAQLEDFKGSIELIFFPKTYEQYGHLLMDDVVLGIKGEVEINDGVAKVKVKEVSPPGGLAQVRSLTFHVAMKTQAYDEKSLLRMRDFLMDYPGASSLYLHYEKEGKKAVIKASSQIGISPAIKTLDALRAQSWVEKVWQE